MVVALEILAIGIVFSAGLVAIQLLPTAEFLLQSQRASNVDYAYALNYSFWPWRFLTLISANLFGNPAHGNYWVTADNYWEDNIYTGVITIVFACVAIGRLIWGGYKKGSFQKTITIFSIFAILVSTIFALGKYTPVFPFFYKFIPTFNMFQAPTRFSIWLILAVSLLAGMGIGVWKKPEGKWLYWSRLLTAGAVGITITSAVAGFVLRSRVQETFINGVAETGVLLSVLLAINLFAPRVEKNREESSPLTTLMTLIVLFLLISDLVYASWGVNPGIKIGTFTDGKRLNNFSTQPEAQSMIYIDDSTEQKLKFERYFRFDSFINSGGWEDLQNYFIPNSNILIGQAAVNNFDPFISARYDTLIKLITPKITGQGSEFNHFWSIGNVINSADSQILKSNIKIDDTYRLRWFTCAISSNGLPQSAELLNNIIKNGTLEKEVVIEGIGADYSRCSENMDQFQVMEYKSNPINIKLNVTAPSDGWLLQLSTNYPGWKVKIDGNEEKVYYGDVLFRAIKLTKGSHIIEFYYQPLSFMLGLSVSFCFLFILLMYIFIKRRNIDKDITTMSDKNGRDQ
jgi:hypothetical protein